MPNSGSAMENDDNNAIIETAVANKYGIILFIVD